MTSDAKTAKAYIDSLPEDRQKVMAKLRSVIKKNLPKGFKERMSGMLNYEVPLSLYPDGYHCKKDTPLPFMNLASQKNFIAVYHMGVYSDPKLLKWFTTEYPKHAKRKLDMGKSCIRIKRMDDIPYDLIGELASKISVDEWIATYEKAIKK